MSNEEYFRCLDRAANARKPEDVLEIRNEVVRRFRGDPRADDLAEALYAHQERLIERSIERTSESSSAGSRAGRERIDYWQA
ncbi:MAG TPA: hypothetical protein VJ596_04290 [Gemmatimonadaceae bacterium]|nr:hypothetical protein [Gemmatimonadaceae bacterium]